MTFTTPTIDHSLVPDLGISDESRQGVVSVLTTVLADEFVLRTKLRNYHWNVRGTLFHALHEMFEEEYDQLAIIIDDIAERIRSYGAMSIGTLQEFKQNTRLDEEPGTYPDATMMVQNLVQDHETMIRNLRDDINRVDAQFNDVGAEDFLTGLLQMHQEMAWMLRSFIER